MTLKEQLIKEIEQTPDTLLTELLDFLLFIKERNSSVNYRVIIPKPVQKQLNNSGKQNQDELEFKCLGK